MRRLRAALEARAAGVVVFDPSRFPAQVSASVVFDADGPRVTLSFDDRRLELEQIGAVWWQRPREPEAPFGVPPEQRDWVARQSKALLDGLWDGLHVTWVPGRRRQIEAADAKVRQLEVARRVGLRVPRTLVTNDPARALRFYDECEGRLVSKVLRDGRVQREGEKHLAFTHVVRRRDLQRLDSVALAPVIFQEIVPKRLELRVTVVGDRVFTAALDSQASPFASEDLRRADDLVACSAHALAPEIEARCVRLVQALELVFGALDLVLTPEGEPVFLEVNSNGRWAWVEARAGLPIAEALAELIVSRSASEHRTEARAGSI